MMDLAHCVGVTDRPWRDLGIALLTATIIYTVLVLIGVTA